MQNSIQVTFQGCEPSLPVRASIEREFESLKLLNTDITGGDVTVIGPSGHHRHGSNFVIHILLTISAHENVVVSHSPDDENHEDVEIAVKDAFSAARRQLDDLRQPS
jgi:hypothetical protein